MVSLLIACNTVDILSSHILLIKMLFIVCRNMSSGLGGLTNKSSPAAKFKCRHGTAPICLCSRTIHKRYKRCGWHLGEAQCHNLILWRNLRLQRLFGCRCLHLLPRLFCHHSNRMYIFLNDKSALRNFNKVVYHAYFDLESTPADKSTE